MSKFILGVHRPHIAYKYLPDIEIQNGSTIEIWRWSFGMHELTKLCRETGSDKGSGSHIYTEFYGPLLNPYRDGFTNILEVGIGTGESLKLWKIFFPNAEVYGIDNLHYGLSLPEHILDDPRLHIYLREAYEANTVDELSKTGIKFDLILDDGSHVPEDQLFFLNNYINLLKEDGILMIEDIHSLGIAYYLTGNFKGNKNRLSIVDRRLNTTQRSIDQSFMGKQQANHNEIIIIYM